MAKQTGKANGVKANPITANAITEAIVTLKRADGKTYSVMLTDMGAKGKKEQYHLFTAPANNPDISNWGGLFMHNARKS